MDNETDFQERIAMNTIINTHRSSDLTGYSRSAVKRLLRGGSSVATFLLVQGVQPRVIAAPKFSSGDTCRFLEPAKEPEIKVISENIAPDFEALAAEYGEPDASMLPTLYAARGSDLKRFRASLSARRMNRAKAAKQRAQHVETPEPSGGER